MPQMNMDFERSTNSGGGVATRPDLDFEQRGRVLTTLLVEVSVADDASHGSSEQHGEERG